MNINEFNTNYLNPLLQKISTENKNLVLMGDFNINLLNAEHDVNISNFVDILSSYSLLPHINLPTRITQHSKTLIDNIFSNLNSDFFSGNILAGISDHLPQFLLIDKFSKYSFVPNYQYRNWKKLNQEIFLKDFKDIQWNKILEFDKNDVNLSFTLLFETLDKLIEKHAPLQTLSRGSKQRTNKPWITKGIIKSMYTRNKLFQSYQREKNPILKCELLTKYKSYRNLITILCKQSKDQYYKSYFATNLHNSKSIWKGINSILGRSKNNKNSSVKSLLVDNSVCSDPQIIANTFNNFFSKVADNVRRKIPQPFYRYSDYLSNPNPNSLFLTPTDSTEILDFINTLDQSKSSGPHSIPPKVLHLIKNDISVLLAKLFNLSFSDGIFPDILKLAKVIPVFKNKGSTLECSNYRPISLLSNVEKIFEKIIYKRTYSFLNRNNVLYNYQFGFRRSFSTSHALMSISQSIYDALDKGNFACALFIDLEKAFDTVDHSILSAKLLHYGIRGTALNLFSSYLKNRKQFVSVSGANSETSNNKHGVPQGSVLGPLLFLIYINDLHRTIWHGKVYHFADDTNLLHVHKSIKSLQHKCQSDINHLRFWLQANKISINASKTEYIIFTPKRKKPASNFKLKINGHRLNSSKKIKYLGIMLDSDLSWRTHIKLSAF